jgi:hypothetical protein
MGKRVVSGQRKIIHRLSMTFVTFFLHIFMYENDSASLTPVAYF